MKPLLYLLSFLIAFPAAAQAGDIILRDPSYYTVDDGVMDHEEMEEEADTIRRLCEVNAYQNKYFDCGCVSAAFLIQREKLGPLATQNEIFDSTTNSANTSKSCVNTEAIAGDAYESCLGFAATFRALAPDNEEYCSCVGSRMATEFHKTPRMVANYIEQLRGDALEKCEDPKNRPKPRSVTDTPPATPQTPAPLPLNLPEAKTTN